MLVKTKNGLLIYREGSVIKMKADGEIIIPSREKESLFLQTEDESVLIIGRGRSKVAPSFFPSALLYYSLIRATGIIPEGVEVHRVKRIHTISEQINRNIIKRKIALIEDFGKVYKYMLISNPHIALDSEVLKYFSIGTVPLLKELKHISEYVVKGWEFDYFALLVLIGMIIKIHDIRIIGDSYSNNNELPLLHDERYYPKLISLPGLGLFELTPPTREQNIIMYAPTGDRGHAKIIIPSWSSFKDIEGLFVPENIKTETPREYIRSIKDAWLKFARNTALKNIREAFSTCGSYYVDPKLKDEYLDILVEIVRW